MTRAERLAEYLAAAARRPIDYATGWDCAAGFVARWVEQERGVDPAEPWRGLYATAEACQALLTAQGGLVDIMRRGFLSCGLQPTQDPSIGDVGAVKVVTARGVEAVGAIRTTIGWAMLTSTGIRASRRTYCLAAWSV